MTFVAIFKTAGCIVYVFLQFVKLCISGETNDISTLDKHTCVATHCSHILDANNNHYAMQSTSHPPLTMNSKSLQFLMKKYGRITYTNIVTVGN